MISPRRLPRLVNALAAGAAMALIVGSMGMAAATEPQIRIFTASDLPSLAGGIRLAEGTHSVRVWGPANRLWTMEKGDDPAVRTLASRVEGDDAPPAWSTLGTIEGGAEFKLLIAPVELPKGEQPPKKPRPAAVPALIALTTEAGEVDPAIELLRGRLDSADPTPDVRRSSSRTNNEGANFQAPKSIEEWNGRSEAVRNRLKVTLGLWPMPPKTNLNPKVYGRVNREGYSIEKVVLETMPGFHLAGNLYRPAKSTGRNAALLCPHGHWEVGRFQEDVQKRCVEWAKLGAVVFSYDMVGFGDSKAFGHKFESARLNRWGLGLAGLQTWDSIRVVDWISGLPDVDPTKIGVTGESGGATQTLFLTAIDPRIAASAPVVMVSDSFQGGSPCENAAGLRIGTDNVEIAALAAPRPQKIVGASGDWSKKLMTNAYPPIRDVYALFERPDNVSAEVFDFPHNYNQTSREAVYNFLAGPLLGLDPTTPIRESNASAEPEEVIRAFDADHPAPADRKTPGQLEEHLVGGMSAEIEALAPKEDASTWEASRFLLKESLRVRVGLVNPAGSKIEAKVVRSSTSRGLTIHHATVGRRGSGEAIPTVRLIPERPNGRQVLFFLGRGKAGLMDDSGRIGPLVRALLDRRWTVVGFDPIFVGESIDPSAPFSGRPEVEYGSTYNPSLAADRMQDLATVSAWAQSIAGSKGLSLVADAGAGPLALMALPVLDGIARSAIDLGGIDPGDGSGPWPRQFDLPGLLQFGGLKSAAALAAPRALWLHHAGDGFDARWSGSAYRMGGSSPALRVDRDFVGPEALAGWIDAGD